MSTLLNLLDAFDDLPQAADLRRRSCRDLGEVVVDVGCGGGRAVGELAARAARDRLFVAIPVFLASGRRQ